MNFNNFPHGWYAILDEQEIKKTNHPYPLIRFGLNLVIWKNEAGIIRVMLDECPHRSAKLSLGRVVNDEIECPFHGFKFCANGSCTYAPEFDKAIPGLNGVVFKSHQRFNMLWVYYGELGSQSPDYGSLVQIDNDCNSIYSFIVNEWKSHITRCIENQLDYTHIVNIHKFGRNFKIPKDPKVEFDESRIKLFLDKKNNTPISEYNFPNFWILNLNTKMRLVVFFVPISATRTRIYIRTYNNIFKFFILRKLFNYVINFSNKKTVKEDQFVVESQGTKPSYLRDQELLMKHDTSIRMFRNLWQKKLNQP